MRAVHGEAFAITSTTGGVMWANRQFPALGRKRAPGVLEVGQRSGLGIRTDGGGTPEGTVIFPRESR